MNTVLTSEDIERHIGYRLPAGAMNLLLGLIAEREAAVLAKLREQEPVAYGMPDTQLGRRHRLMMVRLDKGQDGCTLPLYAAPLPAVVQVPQCVGCQQVDYCKANGCINAAMNTAAAAPEAPAQQTRGERQSCRDDDDMPTEVAVLKREWKAMRLALSMPRTPAECPHCNPAQPSVPAPKAPAQGDPLEKLTRIQEELGLYNDKPAVVQVPRDLPSARDYAERGTMAVTADWMAGWDAARKYVNATPALAPRASTMNRWTERWHGSGLDRGWSIWEMTTSTHGDRVAYVGEGEHSEHLTALIVQKHNESLAAAPEAPAQGQPLTLDEERELFRLREAVKGPDGFATWQEAATAERVRRVKAERELAELKAQPSVPAPWREAVKVAREALEDVEDELGHHRKSPYCQMPPEDNLMAAVRAALAQLDALEGGE